MQIAELTVDVTEAVGLDEPLRTRATLVAPDADRIGAPPVVCFGFPGGGYSRHYFSFDMPGASGGGQAGWHAARGWIFVACDHLHAGESDSPSDPTTLTYERLAAANHATVENVMELLAAGSVCDNLPPLRDAIALGIGQSMGGCLTIVQQGQLGTYDAIGVLGYSAIHTILWVPPGTPGLPPVYVPRGSPTPITATVTAEHHPNFRADPDELPPATPGFHYDDEPREIVAADMIEFPTRQGNVPVWGSATIPPCAVSMTSPGTVAPEAASITVPVLIAVGERDVCPDPRLEPKAFKRSTDLTVFVCPRMSHMHNFASTREQFWARIQSWGASVAAAKNLEKAAPRAGPI